MVKPSRGHMYQCQIEMGKSTERHSTEPIIEIPPTPPHDTQNHQVRKSMNKSITILLI